ncbi:phosphatidylinositol-specific phospholipase C domain-containing protein [Chitinivorax sp. B]|uniref:phosphatidylinositol-specific phospholipase C domain-containing protein n=1 Tax=Chitinivorax sp. B TaxID=2502235 RepID=UPI0010F68923|nr:phosphatidylinositol-specific phospholipase C domain-containing protein [Chitinivorax sp. B]
MNPSIPTLASASWLVIATFCLASDVDDFRQTWTYRTLTMQSALDEQAPLSQSTFLGTHNSYNARAYQTALRYHDPNQERSIYDQLRMGARALELDVHSYTNMSGWPWQWHKDLLLCHAKSNHVGCSGYDRPLKDGLMEIRQWLDETANQPEVLLIYLESHINGGDHGKAIEVLNQQLGNLIYRPLNGTCQGIPMNWTKRQLLDGGKRVLLMSDGCTDANYNSWVFGGIGSHVNGYPTDSQSTYQPYPNCRSVRYSHDDYNRWIIRFYEDRTALSGVFGDPDKPITPDLTEGLLKCGANLFGFDKLTPFDGRLERGVWSWAPSEPNNWNGIEHCAQHWPNGRFNDADCTTPLRFACRAIAGQDWYITQAGGNWSQGAATCSNETGGRYRFAAPFSAFDNEKLKATKLQHAINDVWLNYTDSGTEGHWRIGDM